MTNKTELPKGEATKAVILARVSSKDQEDGLSIEAQKHRLAGYCQRNGLEVLRVFEMTESSTNGDRKKFMEMIKFCKVQRQPIAIVADKVDRVQRSFKEYPLLDALIQTGKIELHFNTENYAIHKNSVSQERMMWSLGVIMAQSYVDSLRDNVKRSIDYKLRLGEYPSMAPIGYLNVNTIQKSDIVIDDFRAHLVRKIFEEFATGAYTLTHITEKAKEWGLRNKARSKGPLIRSHIYKILTNPFYYGIMIVKEKAYPHRYAPLIDKALFDKCQSVLKGWKKKPFKYGGCEFAFRGLLSCVSTGKTVSAFTKKKAYKNGGGGEWTYLQSWDKQGKVIYIREEKILAQAEKALKALKLPLEVVHSIKDCVRSTDQMERDFIRRQNEELQKEHTRIQSRINGLMDLLMDNAITRDEYDNRKAELRQRQIEIENQTANNRQADDGFKDGMQFLLSLCDQVGDIFTGSNVEQKRTILNLVFWNLTLDEKTLCYSYRIPFSAFIEGSKTEEWRHLVERFRTTPELRTAIIGLLQQKESGFQVISTD